MKEKIELKFKKKINSFIKLNYLKKFLITILISLDVKMINNFHYFHDNLENFSHKSVNSKKIKIGIVANSLKNGGAERVTSSILNHFNKVKIFKLFLFSLKGKIEGEYNIDNNIERIIFGGKDLIDLIKKKQIDILLYQFYNYKQINILNKIKNFKLVLINHSCFFFWLYIGKYHFFKTYYQAYKNCDYSISLVPFENDYLFKKWGINSILIPNFVQYEYNEVIPSNLSSNIILMIGRGDDKYKRFDLGIKAMKFIIHEVPQSEMKIMNFLILDYIIL